LDVSRWANFSSAIVHLVAETDSALAWVEAFGPSIVLLFAVILAASLAWKSRRPGRFDAPSWFYDRSVARTGVSDDLEMALDNAVALNSFNVHTGSDPSVRLQAVIRFAPSDFRSVVGEVARHFRTGRVISIDVANMEAKQAVRLVDFCSGMATMCNGWIFRVTDRVIVVTPPN
jgi:hypothetical protein